jgi:hypothetical protein
MVTNTLMGIKRLMRDPAAYRLRVGAFGAGDSPVDFATDVSLARLVYAI